jgi:hypothetical protein
MDIEDLEDLKEKTKTILAELEKEQAETKLAEREKELNRLNEFNQSDGVNGLDPVQKLFLTARMHAMSIYIECLKERLVGC